MKIAPLLISLFLLSYSCIPVRVAPSIKDYKVAKGKGFKKSLSKRQVFIFENPKDEVHFYNYINTKYALNHVDVYDDIPFLIDGNQYFLAWYEVGIQDKSVNFAPAIFNAFLNEALNMKNENTSTTSDDVNRKDNWFLAVEVYSDTEKDCLNEKSLSKALVLKYLRELKTEYLSTHNYNEIVFKN